ncbi:hypothetical protein KSB_31950 [Ktedonobacter robiniae]|uniref:Uncharacterized protein n=1 Tax=Ktedonobacter robiniae TaxID=2778365 RepID=A0ABQ3UPW3_9CHLR|nr:hypothetical protein KSB_31950 [Ktedonobacter robiniae]
MNRARGRGAKTVEVINLFNIRGRREANSDGRSTNPFIDHRQILHSFLIWIGREVSEVPEGPLSLKKETPCQKDALRHPGMLVRISLSTENRAESVAM